jgi:type IV secretory pathway TraG/TraD family ATPase VirD4
MSPKTRSSIITTLKTFMDPMLSAELYYLLFSPKPNFWPSDVLQGKLIVLDYPAESSETARMAAHLLKETIYRTIRTRKEPPSHRRPIAVICDELQAFVSEEDRSMSNVGRGYRLVFLGASQNAPSLTAALGTAESAKSETDAFLANLQTKVITLTVDPTTATYLSDLLGKVRKRIDNGGSGTTFAADGTVSFNSNRGFSETLEYRVEPAQWQTLRAGGREYNLWVDAVIMGSFLGGKTFTNGRRYLKVRFDQSKRLRRGSVRVIAPQIYA